MKKILITGGSGFLGKSLAMRLKKKYKVILASRNLDKLRDASNITGCEGIPIDISNINSVRDIFYRIKPEIVIHAAASKYVDVSENSPNETIDINITGSQNIARLSIETNVKLVIGISTDKSAQPVNNTYGLTKALMERLFFNLASIYSTKFVSVRFGNIAWSTGSVFTIWKNMEKKNSIINSTSPESTRFFLTVNEAVDLVLVSLKNYKKLNGKILTQKMKSAKIKDILEIWCSKNKKLKWKKIKSREGDSLFEKIIGINELQYSAYQKFGKNKYIVIDFNKNDKNFFKKPITSDNASKLTKKEILNLINN